MKMLDDQQYLDKFETRLKLVIKHAWRLFYGGLIIALGSCFFLYLKVEQLSRAYELK